MVVAGDFGGVFELDCRENNFLRELIRLCRDCANSCSEHRRENSFGSSSAFYCYYRKLPILQKNLLIINFKINYLFKLTRHIQCSSYK